MTRQGSAEAFRAMKAYEWVMERTCTSKVAYRTQGWAYKVLHYISHCENAQLRESMKGARPYRCQFCGDFHLGHPTKGRPVARNLTRQDVAEWLRYDADTGLLYWVKSRGSRARAGSVAGSAHSMGYRRVNLHGRQMLAHRVAFLLTYGRWPEGPVDHENGERSTNTLGNLREATTRKNAQNQKIRADSRSGLKGVTHIPSKKPWRALICVDGKIRSLGYHPTPEAAHAAYVDAAKIHFGTFARAA